MTVYEKELVKLIEKRFASLSPGQITAKLIEMGVVDFSRCKILAVREHVGALVRSGIRKTDAMWEASEKFACTYEYIRKCLYYYKDVNI